MAAAVALGVPRRSVSGPPMGLAQTPYDETAQAAPRQPLPAQPMPATTPSPAAGTETATGDDARRAFESYWWNNPSGTQGGNAQPAQPVPLPPNTVPPPTAPQAQSFTGTAPTPTHYGDFAGPNPANIASDPYYQFRLSEGLKQQQRGAASRGTLLTGGFQKALMGYGQGLASEESGKAFDRALQTYDTNRSTNAQNFGQSMDQYQGSLAGFNANTSAALGYGRLGLDTQNSQYEQGRQNRLDTQNNAQRMEDANAARAAAYQEQSDAAYARSVAATRQANAAPSAPVTTVQGQLATRKLINGMNLNFPASVSGSLNNWGSLSRGR